MSFAWVGATRVDKYFIFVCVCPCAGACVCRVLLFWRVEEGLDAHIIQQSLPFAASSSSSISTVTSTPLFVTQRVSACVTYRGEREDV